MSFLKKESALFYVSRILSRMTLHGSLKVWHAGHDAEGPVIYVANHPSSLDPYFVIGSLPSPARILISEFIFGIPFVGFLLKQAGHIKVENGKGNEAYQKARDILKRGKSLLIFPEGSVSKEKTRVNDLHTGAVRLAMETRIPVVPIGIYLNPDKIKKHTIYFGKNKEVGSWYTNGMYGMTYGKKISFIGDTRNKEEVRRQCHILKRHMEEQILASAESIKSQNFDEIHTTNLLYLFIYFFRMRFAYANWINS